MGYVRPDYDANHTKFQQWVEETIIYARRHHYKKDLQEAISLLDREIALFDEGASGDMFSSSKRILLRLRKGSKEMKKHLECIVDRGL